VQAVPLLPLLERMCGLLAAEARAIAVEPQIDCLPADLAARADPVALEQIVHNLMANALQALAQVPTPERRLTIEARASGQRVVLTVRDSGPGIAPDALPHLFEPFFTTREGGLGLGLPLGESLALGMGGALTGGNDSPRGAWFRLELPIA